MRGLAGGRLGGVAGGGFFGDAAGEAPVGAIKDSRPSTGAVDGRAFTAAIGRIAAALANVRCICASASRLFATHWWNAPTVSRATKKATARRISDAEPAVCCDRHCVQPRARSRCKACLTARIAQQGR